MQRWKTRKHTILLISFYELSYLHNGWKRHTNVLHNIAKVFSGMYNSNVKKLYARIEIKQQKQKPTEIQHDTIFLWFTGFKILTNR